MKNMISVCTNYSKKIFLSLSIFFLVLSCKEKEEDYSITSLNPVKLPEESESYRIEEGCYSSFFILDSFLIMTPLCNLERNSEVDKKIYVFNKKTLQLVAKFGTRGMANFEFLSTIFPLSTVRQKSDSILFYDSMSKHFKTVNLNKFLSGVTVADCISSTAMYQDLMSAVSLKIVDESKFVCRSHQDAERTISMFFIYDTKKNEMKRTKPIPNLKVDEQHRKFLYHGVLGANGSKKSIVYSTRYFDQIIFYDLNGNIMKHHVFSPLIKPELSNQYLVPVPESTLNYALDIYETSAYCFLTTRCYQFGDNQRNLLIFNWEGLLINTFEFFPNTRICYDEEFECLYTFESSEEENDPYMTVRKYNIGEYLKVNQ